MTDDISKVKPAPNWCPACGQRPNALTFCAHPFHRLKSTTTPAEVDVPTIDRDEAFQRDYIPLGRSGWEIQTKGKGSTYRICDKDGDRLAIPDAPYLHETLTRMARDVHADYATLARQLAEAKEGEATRRSEVRYWFNAVGAANTRAEQAESQLAEAEEDRATARRAAIANEQEAERLGIQLAEATRRLGEVEGLLRRHISADVDADTTLYAETKAALTKEPTT